MHSIHSDQLRVTAADGHTLTVYRARPTPPTRGSVLIVQEIFGVTAHIQAVADTYAKAGYEALAPQLFDRVAPDLLVPYADIPQGLAHAYSIEITATLADLRACRDAAERPDHVAVVGFCWGGKIAYWAGCRLDLRAAVSYYGGGLVACLGEKPTCPVLFHFGEHDSSIPLSDVAQIQAALPDAECHLYAAGHAFNNSDRSSFEPISAALSLERSVDFLRRHLG
jgi:carboxymethylenebutenolidase